MKIKNKINLTKREWIAILTIANILIYRFALTPSLFNYLQPFFELEQRTEEVVEIPLEVPVELDETLDTKQVVMAMVAQAGLDPFEAYAIIQCESGWNQEALGVNYSNRAGADRGLFQISDKYHPEVSNACAFDPVCNTKEAIRIYKECGNSWDVWSCGKKLGL